MHIRHHICLQKLGINILIFICLCPVIISKILMVSIAIADTRTGPRPENTGSADNQRAPQIPAAAAGSNAPPPADNRRPADNPAEDRALVPYQAEAGGAR
jgi:hypothetical protein